MCMELLQRLANARLPLTIVEPEQIDKVRRLDAASYIAGFIPRIHLDTDRRARQDPASVMQITARGYDALKQMARSPEASP